MLVLLATNLQFTWKDREILAARRQENFGWKNKWFAHFRLGRFRKLGFDLRRPCNADLGILCSGSFSHYGKSYSFMFLHKISTRVVCVNGKHPSNIGIYCWGTSLSTSEWTVFAEETTHYS